MINSAMNAAYFSWFNPIFEHLYMHKNCSGLDEPASDKW